MKYNYKYRDSDGNAAPYVLTIGERRVINPTAEQYAEAGYLPYVTPQPTAAEIAESRRQEEIAEAKAQLEATDYIALKAIEGYDCDELYPNWRAERKRLRERINELEMEGGI